MENEIEVLCNFTISGITPHNWIFLVNDVAVARRRFQKRLRLVR